MNMNIRQLRDMPLPAYAHEGDAGLDLRSAENCSIAVGRCHLTGTGTQVEIPSGHVGLVFPRSGLGSKGLTLRNAVGVIDSGYRGEIKAALWNVSNEPWRVSRGDRIAQLVIVPFATVRPVQVETLGESERGEDGHGSTGVK